MGVAAGAENLALKAKYRLWPAPNYALCSDPDDKVQLTDGQTTKKHFWTQKGTVGWNHAPYVSIVVDLGRDQPIEGVALETAAGAANVEWPSAIEILVSTDGKTYYDVGDLVALDHGQNGAWPKGYAIRQLVTHLLRTHGRYVQFVMIPRSGSPYMFVDEVEVFGGSAELLQEPLKGEVVTDVKKLYLERRLSAALRHRFEADVTAMEEEIRGAKVDAATTEGLLGQLAKVRVGMENDLPALPGKLAASGTFRAVLPMGEAHAALFRLQADLWRSERCAPLTAWVPAPWDPVALFGKPSDSVGAIEVHTLRGEYRAAAVNLANTTGKPLRARVYLADEKGQAGWLDRSVRLHEVPWTDTSMGQPVASALPEVQAGPQGRWVCVEPGLVRQVWMTFHVDAAPGMYEGCLVIEPEGGAAVRVPARVRVWPGEFPKETTLALGGWCYTDGKGYSGVTSANREAFIGHLKERFVNCPWASAGVLMSCKYVAGNRPRMELDTQRLDEWIARWPNARQYMVFLSMKGGFQGTKIDTPEFQERVGAWISAWVRHLGSKGISADRLALLIHDEPHEKSDVAPLVAWARAIRAAEPKVVIWEDPTYRDPRKAPGELFAVSHVLCPNRPMWLANNKLFTDFYLEQQRKGATLNLYSCSGPAKLLDPYSYYRLQAWHAWQIGGTGSFFWSFADNDGSSSWNEYTAKAGPYTPLFLDDESVVAGKQMEAIRESAEDFEYLVMLGKAVAAAKLAGKTGAAVAQAERLLAEGPRSVLTAPDAEKLRWMETKDRTIADAVRVKILETLAALWSGG
jgi:hypothetical protein